MKTHLQLLYYILTVKSLNVVGQTPFSVVQYPSSASLLMATLTASNQLPPSLHVGHLSYGFLGGGSGVHQGYEWIPKVNGFQEKLRNGWKSSDASAIFSYLQLSSAIFSYLQPYSAIFSHLQLSSAIFSHLQLSSAIFSFNLSTFFKPKIWKNLDPTGPNSPATSPVFLGLRTQHQRQRPRGHGSFWALQSVRLIGFNHNGDIIGISVPTNANMIGIS